MRDAHREPRFGGGHCSPPYLESGGGVFIRPLSLNKVMNKTKIEWCDYTINPVKGLCPVACPYCYARAMYKRFKWNPEIRFDVNSFLPLLLTIRRKPSRIFIGSTMELFGDWVKPEWMQFIFERVKMRSEHTFIFLTKQPQELFKWSPFPDNCWVGVSVTNQKAFNTAMKYIPYLKAPVTFLSIEPMLRRILTTPGQLQRYINWLIIGGQSGTKKFYPLTEWIQEIESAADNAGIPIFEKNNLRQWSKPLRQEMPKG